jgi:two-component system LytT family response regulator
VYPALSSVDQTVETDTSPSPDDADESARRSYLKYLPIHRQGKIFLHRVSDVSWFEANGKYVYLHIESQKPLIRRSMNWLESALDPAQFMRISRSAIINIDHVVSFERWGASTWIAAMDTSHRVRSGRSYNARVKQLLGQT